MKLLILFLMINSAFAWELKRENRKVHLLDSAKKVDELVVASTDEKLQVKQLNEDFTLLTYFENEAGTKEVTRTYNCAVYSESRKRMILKDKICKTVSAKETVNAEFTPTGSKLKYKFEELEQVIQ